MWQLSQQNLSRQLKTLQVFTEKKIHFHTYRKKIPRTKGAKPTKLPLGQVVTSKYVNKKASKKS